MNERIKQLMPKPWTFPYPDRELYTKEQFEKFAELIVAEMLQICEDHPAWTGRMIGEQIKQHFEIEEPKGWICPKCNADRTKIACPLGFGATVDGRCPMTVEAQ
jgi:hypothetical protein